MTQPVLPNFLVIGAMKCGTTAVHEYLRSHPQVFMPEEKEPSYFAREDRWSRGMDWYADLFASATEPIRGEASTDYTKPQFPEAPERIRDALGTDIKLVYVVREPLQRIRSHYDHGAVAGWGPAALTRQALTERPEAVGTTQYTTMLSRYSDIVSSEQIHVLTADSLRSDRWATLDALCEFLGAEPGWRPPNVAGETGSSADMRAARQLVGSARRIPGARAAWHLVPQAARAPLVRRLSRMTGSPEASPEWFDADTERWLLELLTPEVAGLRQWLGEDFDGWGLLD